LAPSQVSVLVRLEKDGPAAVSTLARAEGMRPQSMSAIITSLLESGLVCGSPDPNDGRQTLMSLSRKCQKILKKGPAAKQDWLATTIQGKLSVQDQENLAAVLELLARLVGRGAGQTDPSHGGLLHLPRGPWRSGCDLRAVLSDPAAGRDAPRDAEPRLGGGDEVGKANNPLQSGGGLPPSSEERTVS